MFIRTEKGKTSSISRQASSLTDQQPIFISNCAFWVEKRDCTTTAEWQIYLQVLSIYVYLLFPKSI
jgi:hypothetical protein